MKLNCYTHVSITFHPHIISFTFLTYGRAGTTASWTCHRPSAMTRTATGGRPLRRWARNAVVWASAPTTGCCTCAAVSTARPAWAASNGMIRWPASGRLAPAWPPAAGTAASPSSVSLVVGSAAIFVNNTCRTFEGRERGAFKHHNHNHHYHLYRNLVNLR